MAPEKELLKALDYLSDPSNPRERYLGGFIFKADFENQETGKEVMEFLMEHGVESELVQYLEENDESHEVNLVYHQENDYQLFRDEV